MKQRTKTYFFIVFLLSLVILSISFAFLITGKFCPLDNEKLEQDRICQEKGYDTSFEIYVGDSIKYQCCHRFGQNGLDCE
jgi:hypothetical protein